MQYVSIERFEALTEVVTRQQDVLMSLDPLILACRETLEKHDQLLELHEKKLELFEQLTTALTGQVECLFQMIQDIIANQ